MESQNHQQVELSATRPNGTVSTSGPSHPPPGQDTAGHDWAEFSDAWEANVAQPGRKALQDFFYPVRQQPHPVSGSSPAQAQDQPAPQDQPPSQGPLQTPPPEQDTEIIQQEQNDRKFVESFWTIYDDIIILSLFTQIGIICRLGAAYSFRYFDTVFRHDSALFTNLPLNCLACFVMGLLCSGESLMEIVSTKFTPPRLQSDLHYEAREQEAGHEDDFDSLQSSPASPQGLTRRRRKKTNARASGWRPRDEDFYSELREVQLLALERRMRASPCLVLFHVGKEDVDVVEDYFNQGYRANEEKKEDAEYPTLSDHGQRFDLDDHDLTLEAQQHESDGIIRDSRIKLSNSSNPPVPNDRPTSPTNMTGAVGTNYTQVDGENSQYHDLDQIVADVATDVSQRISTLNTDVSQRISTLNRVNLADGWDVGTTPEEKTKDLMLGLRDGLCGALSSFSSWMSSMVALFRVGQIGEGFIGLVIGIQLPIIAYQFGQHVAVYIFAWRCKRETRRDERRGYGIRLNMEDDESEGNDQDPTIEAADSLSSSRAARTQGHRSVEEEGDRATPSVRAVITVLMIISMVAQITSLNFYHKSEDRLIALSLLFSPLGVLTRWRLSKYNSWRPNFPIGTFICNILACALAGTLGRVLAGNPGNGERIFLVALVAGFGGTLSSVARFIVETIAGVDPILLRADGFYYSIISVGCGILVSFLFSTSVDWADDIKKDEPTIDV